MVRLVMILLFLALCVGVTYMIVQFIARLWEAAGDSGGGKWIRGEAMTSNSALNKLAFVLLLCLVLYVSVQGAG